MAFLHTPRVLKTELLAQTYTS